jgi:hypothetical protein
MRHRKYCKSGIIREEEGREEQKTNFSAWKIWKSRE